MKLVNGMFKMYQQKVPLVMHWFLVLFPKVAEWYFGHIAFFLKLKSKSSKSADVSDASVHSVKEVAQPSWILTATCLTS